MKKIISLVLTLALLVSVLAAMPVLAADSELVGTDVTLTEGFSLNFYIKADGNQTVTNATPVTKNGVDCYKLTVNLGAKNMGDALEAQLKNGSVSVGDAYTSSVKDYASRLLAITYDKATINLVSAMLGYGAAAQNYFGYKTNALVGTPVTDLSDLEAAVAPETSVVDFSDTYIGASLVLEGDMLLRFYFRGNGLNVTSDGKPLNVTDKSGYCYADVAVMPDKIAECVTVTCGDTEVTYSTLTYLKNKMHDESLSEMVASIYAYGIAAEEYVRTSGCDHEGLTYDKVVQLPTLFNGGLNEGVCPTCGGTITEAVGKTEADVKKYNASSLSPDDSNNRGSFSSAVNIVDDVLAGGKHFYPDEENGGKGRDLYVEFSFLYNETLKNNDNGFIDIFRIEDENAHSSTPSNFSNYQAHTFYFLNVKNNASGQWCPYEGGFETGDIDSAAGGIFAGPPMPDSSGSTKHPASDYLFIGDYGWHRLGIRVHQTAAISNGKVVYKVETSFYIDGDLVSQYYTNLIAKSYNDLLFTAEISGGKLVYSDIAENKNFLYYKIREVMSSSTYYVATADEYATAVTVGENADPKDGFVLDVEKIKNPTKEDFVADGDVTLDGTRHFKLKGDVVDVAEPASENDSGEKVLLISVDGLRPDAIAETEYYEILKSMGSYTLSAETIYPSKTMPAHMSMFHSVSPETHGMETNTYAPSANLGNGITEVLAAQGYTMAMFFDWENMQYLTSVQNSVERNYIQWYKSGSEQYHEISTVQLTDAILEHIATDPTDLTYLYFGMTDQMGHENNWLSDEYYYAIEHIFTNILRILEALPKEYTVIITSDHGGGGDLGANNHGSSNPVDMTTPVFIIGDGFEAGVSLGNGVSILDIAPTVADILGVTAESYWEGRSLVTASQDAAKDILLDRNSWGQYYKHGIVKSVNRNGDSATINLTNNGSTNMAGTQLNKAAVGDMLDIGYRYLSFTIDYEAGSKGITPDYACIYYFSRTADSYFPADFFVSAPDRIEDEPYEEETYYADGRQVIIDLSILYSYLRDGEGLIFILSNDDKWTATYDGSITLDNVIFTNDLTDFEPKADDKDRVLLVSVDGLRPDALSQTEYFEILKSMGAYTTSAQTINPSVTMPAHMSMFHSVPAETHGITKNDQTPTYSGNGITETLSEAGLTSAMFYDYNPIKTLTTDPDGVERNHVEPGELYKPSVAKLCNAALDHITYTPTDFTFLYFGHTDEIGHQKGWMTSDYMSAIDYVFENLIPLLEAIPENYTVIITSDHGGGGYLGSKNHGSTSAKDMYIPVFIIGDGIEAGAELRNDVSILDIAPTVVDLLGVEAEDYWVGQSLVSAETQAREDMATDLFLSEDSWIDYTYGKILNKTATASSITMQVSGREAGREYAGVGGLQLSKEAISEMVSLGYRYLTFTVTMEAADPNYDPDYVVVYTYNGATDFLVSAYDTKDGAEFCFTNGREITVDLWTLYYRLATTHGLIFILSDYHHWKPTYGGYITFSNVKLSTELD